MIIYIKKKVEKVVISHKNWKKLQKNRKKNIFLNKLTKNPPISKFMITNN